MGLWAQDFIASYDWASAKVRPVLHAAGCLLLCSLDAHRTAPTHYAPLTEAPPHRLHTHPLQVVRRIDVAARGVYWSEGGSLVAIATDASFYMLEYARDVAEQVLGSGQVGELSFCWRGWG